MNKFLLLLMCSLSCGGWSFGASPWLGTWSGKQVVSSSTTAYTIVLEQKDAGVAISINYYRVSPRSVDAFDTAFGTYEYTGSASNVRGTSTIQDAKFNSDGDVLRLRVAIQTKDTNNLEVFYFQMINPTGRERYLCMISKEEANLAKEIRIERINSVPGRFLLKFDGGF